MENKYYLNKYLLAIYDKEDFIVAVADNVVDLMKLFFIPINKTTLNRMTSKIGHALKRGNRKIYINGKVRFVYCIPVETEEEL